MPNLLSLFHRLPYPLRVLAVSLQGYYINSWRYNANFERLVDEALDRERWPVERWKDWQAERLSRMLHHAATSVPYYQQQWAARRRNFDRASWDYIENWPLLKKDSLRESPEAFISSTVSRRSLLKERTGGTTGTPLQLFAGKDTLTQWYALSEARWHRWYGVDAGDRWANIGVRPVVPYNASHPPFWVWNAAMKQLYLSALHMKTEFIEAIVQALRRYRVSYLYGYPSAYFWIARHLIDHGEELPMQVVITSSEQLFDYQREAMEQAFGCPVRETYGQSEKLCAASQCEFGRLHLWPEAGYTEFLALAAEEVSSSPHTPGIPAAGQHLHSLVCTTLINPAMPLIRYDMQDLVELPSSTAHICPCGRGLPLMGKIIGRYEDTILTTDGRRVGHLVGILSAGSPVKEIQVVQESLKNIHVKVVPAHDWSHLDEKAMRDKLKSRIGESDIKIELVDEIERSASGKFRAVVSKVESILPESKQ